MPYADQGLNKIPEGVTHCYPLSHIEKAYEVFENRQDGVIKIAITEG